MAMTIEERQFVLDQLDASEVRLLDRVEGLTPAQWAFRESAERWAIAENIEHLIVFENFILETIQKTLSQPPENDKRASAAAKEQIVLKLAKSRATTKLIAREPLRPSGRWQDMPEMLAEWKRTRARTVTFALETQADLRSHFFPHIALGDLDCYQWLVVVGQHTERHILQIEEVMADPAYPAA